jgi:peptidoglycan-associated lipoprotein
MKLIKLCNLTVFASALAIAFAGCTTSPQKPTVIPGSRGNPGDMGLGGGQPLPPIGGPGTEPGGGFTPPTPGGAYTGPEDAMMLKPQTIYFDLDKSAVKAGELSKLDQVASYLKSNPEKGVRVEGNCDERGTEEYNRSLGERRALAAREYLIQSGIDPKRVETLTNGEDKPAVTGHNEAAWSKNRRDDFIVLTAGKP